MSAEEANDDSSARTRSAEEANDDSPARTRSNDRHDTASATTSSCSSDGDDLSSTLSGFFAKEFDDDLLAVRLSCHRSLRLHQSKLQDSRGAFFIPTSRYDASLGLTAYLQHIVHHHYGQINNEKITSNNNNNGDWWNNVTLLDLHSLHGLVGFSVAALSRGRALTVVAASEATAIETLKDNACLNTDLWKFGKRNSPPEVQLLEWKSATGTINLDWLQRRMTGPIMQNQKQPPPRWRQQTSHPLVDTRLTAPLPANLCSIQQQQQAQQRAATRVFVTAADVFHDPDKFVPLLATLSELDSRLRRQLGCSRVTCLLACSSHQAAHLPRFCKTARQNGMDVRFLARADVEEQKEHQHQQQPPPEQQEQQGNGDPGYYYHNHQKRNGSSSTRYSSLSASTCCRSNSTVSLESVLVFPLSKDHPFRIMLRHAAQCRQSFQHYHGRCRRPVWILRIRRMPCSFAV